MAYDTKKTDKGSTANEGSHVTMHKSMHEQGKSMPVKDMGKNMPKGK